MSVADITKIFSSRTTYIRNLGSTRVLEARFLLPNRWRIERNICIQDIKKNSWIWSFLITAEDVGDKYWPFAEQRLAPMQARNSAIPGRQCRRTVCQRSEAWSRFHKRAYRWTSEPCLPGEMQTCDIRRRHGWKYRAELEVITIIKDAFFDGFKELHSYDPLQHQLVLHYIVHFRVSLWRDSSHM